MARHIQGKIAGKDDVDKREVLKGEPKKKS